MSIDARIAGVTVFSNNGRLQLKLLLESREEGGYPGQPALTIVNPPDVSPDLLSSLIGTEIWGGANDILVGDTIWAKRLSYTTIELVEVEE